MNELEKERLVSYIADISQEEIKFLVTLIDSDVMLDEIARREKLSQVKLSVISSLMKIN